MVVARELLPIPRNLWPPAIVGDGSVPTRRRRADHRQLEHSTTWANESLDALNWLNDRQVFGQFDKLSEGQASAVEFVSSTISSSGPPPCSSAAASKELCGASPGYQGTSEKKYASYAAGHVSLPTPGPKCDAGPLLAGNTRDLWYDWQCKLMRNDDGIRAPVKPHIDAKLHRSRSSYAEFILLLYDVGVIDFRELRAGTLGVLFAPKGLDKLRLIFGTRAINQEFRDPDYASLPTAGCWRTLRTAPGDTLDLSQVDVEAAFYRIANPPG
jgi:hypothetical protein